MKTLLKRGLPFLSLAALVLASMLSSANEDARRLEEARVLAEARLRIDAGFPKDALRLLRSKSGEEARQMKIEASVRAGMPSAASKLLRPKDKKEELSSILLVSDAFAERGRFGEAYRLLEERKTHVPDSSNELEGYQEELLREYRLIPVPGTLVEAWPGSSEVSIWSGEDGVYLVDARGTDRLQGKRFKGIRALGKNRFLATNDYGAFEIDENGSILRKSDELPDFDLELKVPDSPLHAVKADNSFFYETKSGSAVSEAFDRASPLYQGTGFCEREGKSYRIVFLALSER